MLGLVGRKCGMTRVFNDDGTHVPVTVIEVEPNRVTQVKTVENDGYSAVQVTVGERRLSRVTKPLKGHYEKAGTQPGRGLWEFRLNAGEGSDLAPGSEIKADLFANGQFVDVTGITVGKGFQGVVKRHHFRGGRASHGNSLSHRAPGSIGQRQTPGRTFLNMKMAGHMGDVQRTVQNLQVVRVDLDRNVLLVKGGVPGAEGSDVIVRPAIKKMKTKKAG